MLKVTKFLVSHVMNGCRVTTENDEKEVIKIYNYEVTVSDSNGNVVVLKSPDDFAKFMEDLERDDDKVEVTSEFDVERACDIPVSDEDLRLIAYNQLSHWLWKSSIASGDKRYSMSDELRDEGHDSKYLANYCSGVSTLGFTLIEKCDN